jgi:molecular chaperone IbpA|tara:strand:- start:239 stop:679 length:441 start_codon:yes stop_codon:yes gene_type:complete
MNKSLSIFNQLRPFTIGYDNVFDRFESMFDNDHFFSTTSNYPPYNIVKTGDYTYDIELALAGFGKKDIDVNYADSQLTIKSIKDEKAEEDADGVLHKGISKRQFSRTFTIADDVEVKGAELKDGLLKVSLEKIIPDSKKPRTIQIK